MFENQREFLFELTFIVKDVLLIRLNKEKIVNKLESIKI